ncbi:acyl-CoA dehydrogenase family protein [Rhodococcus sp. T7]|uniref:acyl-CoA dehydrogenase family protein n=1 Tax=Rhodococcus sp. T7 TaxID=627444 RepID=UPI0013583CFE|nr:acyl-CoA dehydrogenase family protein [Rhodococcus sp. T7]KAF0956989.1 Acyl-CoA dehydrogenase [Rhodococcus sp. T7]KAF0958694.1 Acyl-CoA dehydrogenase [Rhodococcus sp. T7]
MNNDNTRAVFDNDHDAFRESVRHFLRAEVEPHLDGWRSANGAPADFYRCAGKEGLLGTAAPERFGGGGVDDLRFVAVLVEETAALGATGLAHLLALHSGVVLPALLRHGSEEACATWLPDMVAGERLAVPLGAGKPAEATSEDGRVLLHGHVDGVAGGACAGILLTAVSGEDEPRLTVLSGDTSGLIRSPVADALGGRESAQADVTLGAVEVGRADSLGTGAWAELTRDLDLWSAVTAMASARSVIAITLRYVAERQVFGRPLAQFENTRHRLAEVAARLSATELLVDSCLVARCENRLTAAAAATACLEAGALHDEAVDRGLQLHGGYGYMREYPISHAFADAQYLRQQEHLVADARDLIAAGLGL